MNKKIKKGKLSGQEWILTWYNMIEKRIDMRTDWRGESLRSRSNPTNQTWAKLWAPPKFASRVFPRSYVWFLVLTLHTLDSFLPQPPMKVIAESNIRGTSMT
jgi:hypothetical protein